MVEDKTNTLEVNGIILDVNHETLRRLNILRAEYSEKKKIKLEWPAFLNVVYKLDKKNKSIDEVRKEVSAKRNTDLNWNQFFNILFGKIELIRTITIWSYTILLFVLITIVLLLPFYTFGVFNQAYLIIPLFVVVGLILAFLSAFIIGPLSLRKICKPYHDAPKEMQDIISEITQKLSITKKTELMIDESPEVNAMTWSTFSSHKICVTKGLMDAYRNNLISLDEIKSIFGHEFGHIVHRDVFKMEFVRSWISIFKRVGTHAIFIGGVFLGAGGVKHTVSHDDDNSGLFFMIAGFILLVIGFIMRIFAKIADIIAFNYSRNQEFEADRVGAEITDPILMVQSLNKIEALGEKLVAEQIAALPWSERWQIAPKNESSIDRLFSTHPPIPKRVGRLEKVASYL